MLETAEATTSAAADVPARVVIADDVLLGSVDLARRALLEVTAPETVGSVVGHVADDEHVLTILFASDLSGYPGWHWSVTLARVDDAGPTVLETELMPGATALLAPEWVPWSERLAEYRAAQEAAAAAVAASRGEADADAPSDDESESDEAEDYDEDGDDDDEDDDDDDFEGGDDDAELAAAFGDDGDDEFDGIDIDALDDSSERLDASHARADDGDDADGDRSGDRQFGEAGS